MRRWSIPVVAVLAAVLFGRLGVWQLDRLGQRRARNAEIGERLEQSPISIPPVPAVASESSLVYRRVTARGHYDFDRQVVEMARSHQGAPAVHIVTPLVFGDSVAVLVERGWMPSPDGRLVDIEGLAEPEETIVEGTMLPVVAGTLPSGTGWPRYVRSADPTVLQPLFPYPLLPTVLRRTTPASGTPPDLRAIPMPTLDNGPHLSYAIQWFAFATIAVVGGAVLFRRVRET